MADNTERLLFEVEAVVRGQQQLIQFSETLVRFQSAQARALRTAAAAQAEQAAATKQVVEATRQLDATVTNLPAKEIAVATSATAIGTAFLTLDTIIERVVQSFELVRGVADSILETGFAEDRFVAQFTVLRGSAAQARAELESLRQFAKTYNLNFDGVREGAAVLERLGVTGPEALRAVANASVVTGKSMAEIASQLGGVARGQLRGFLDLVPAASSALVKANAEIEAGARKSPEAIRFLIQQAIADLQSNFGSGLDTFAELTESKLKAVSGRMEEFRQRIFQSGVGAAFESVVDEVLLQIDRLDEDGTLDAWAVAMGNAARVGADALRLVIGLAPTAIAALNFTVVTTSVILLGSALGGLASVIPAIASLVGVLLAGGFRSFAVAVDFATVGMGAFRAAALALVSPLGIAGLAIAATVTGVNLLADALSKPFVLKIDADASLKDVYGELARLRNEKAKLEGGAAAIEIAGAAPGVIGGAGAIGGVVAGQVLSSVFRPARTAAEVSIKRAEDQRVRTQGGEFGPPKPPEAKPPDDTAAKKAHDEAMRRAQQLLAEVQRTEKEASAAVLREVENRVDASGTEGAARLRLFDQYAEEELAKLRGNSERRAQLEAQLAADIADKRLVIERTTTGKIRDEQLKQLDFERQRGESAIALVYDNGLAVDDARRKLATKRASEEAAEDRRQAAERARLLVDDAQFERDIYGLTTGQYIRELLRRRAAQRADSAEAQAIDRELRATRQAQSDAEDRKAARGAAFAATGLTPEQANAAANIEEGIAKAQQFARDEEEATFLMRVQLLDQFAGIHDKAWADMTDAERAAHAQNVRLAQNTYFVMTRSATSAYDTIKKSLLDLAHNEEAQMNLARSLTDKNAKLNVVAAAEQAEGELKAIALVAAVKALFALGEGLLFNPKGFAAAAAYGQAAALAGAGAIAAGALARSVGESAADDRDREYARQHPAEQESTRQRQATAARDVGLSVSQGNQPITLQFYNTTTFEGGAVFLGASADAFVDAIIPGIQRAFDLGQLRVPNA